MENKPKRQNPNRIVSIVGRQREYTSNNTKYIVESRFVEPTFTDKDRTIADIMECILNNEFIDLFCENEKS